ncbi:MAG: hypothetical protein F9K47_07650 [Burkholderiales bacterium]|nr:MAG: hypothetical protein F9K47_07650 [Burkholderiales bacterium]
MATNPPRAQAQVLASGRSCQLAAIRNDLIPNYYLLAFPIDQGQPSAAEVTEMLNLGISYARDLAARLLDDPEAYTILYSGYSARREKGWHVHIVPAWKPMAQGMALRRVGGEKSAPSHWPQKRRCPTDQE